ncbi:Retrovirus-related Pol polyprotein from transposon TNT 1-94, partial [Erysiphe neolycopersici]
MILVSSRKNNLNIDEFVSILASKETELNDPISERDNSSDVVNFAGHGRNNKHIKGRIGTNKKPLYCGYHRAQVGHIQNDCPDYLRTEPGKMRLKSDAGVAWTKGAFERANSYPGQKKMKGSNNQNKMYAVEESSDEMLNMVRHVNISDKYESDDSMCLNVPCDAAFAVPQVIKNPDWYLDTCATKHITPNLEVFIVGSLKPHKVSIKCADNNFLVSEGIGDVKIEWEDDERTARRVTIRDALFIPHAGDNLLSLGILRNDKLHLYKNDRSRALLTGVLTSAKIWKVQRTLTNFVFSSKQITKLSLNRSKQELLHARLGHMGSEQTKRINRMVDGLNNITVHPCVCVTCMKAKITRTVSRKPMTKFENPGDRVHVDLLGPLQIKSLQGNKIMITFTDQSSKMV